MKILYKTVLKKDRIILLKGENGRKLIELSLQEKGFKICVVECYKRVLKEIDGLIEGKKWRSYKINTLVATSGEILYELKNIISERNQNEWLFKCKIFVVGKRLLKIAKILGWQDIIVSQYANNEYLLQVIRNLYFK